jgi:hypothetical protein
MNRRHFLGAAAAVPLLDPKRVMGANDRLRVEFTGLGGQANRL